MIFLLGLLLRLALIFVDSSWDVNSFIAWSEDLVRYGPSGFYDKISTNVFAAPYPNYPPLTLFFFYLSNQLFSAINWLVWKLNILIPIFPSNLVFVLQERSILAGLMKIWPILADVGIAYVIYLLTDKKNRLYPIFILFNPAFIYSSALWGQVDSIPIFFFLLSIYFILNKKNLMISSLFLALSLISKQTIVIALPIYLLFIFKEYRLKGLIIHFAVIFLTLSITFLPFHKSGSYYLKLMTASGLPFVSNGAFNFWALVTSGSNMLRDSEKFILNIPFQTWGYILTAIIVAPVLAFFYKGRDSLFKVSFSLTLFLFAIYLFLTKIHERHFLQVLPFVLLMTYSKKKYLKVFILLSFFHLVNLYHNWSAPYQKELVNFLSNLAVVNIFIVIGLGAFIYLYREFLLGSKLNAKD